MTIKYLALFIYRLIDFLFIKITDRRKHVFRPKPKFDLIRVSHENETETLSDKNLNY